MGIGIDLGNIGIRNRKSGTPAPAQPRQEARPDKAGALVPGSTLARALYEVWSGRRVTVIDSPPGAGKTTLVIELVTRLCREGFNVRIVTPTNASGSVVAKKLMSKGVNVTTSTGIAAITEGVVNKDLFVEGSKTVEVSTIASAGMRAVPKDAAPMDVTIVDEAYQATLASVLQAVDNSRQLVMVGDPGQIGPVVTSSTAPWDHLGDVAPHAPAPHAMAAREDAVTLTLPSTYRLGNETVNLIAPLYGFGFDSRRPAIHLTTDNGTAVPEVMHLEVPDGATAHDPVVMRAAVTRALSLVGTTVTTADGEQKVNRKDIAVVVSHNSQRASVESMLNAESDVRHGTVGAEETGIAVGTADSLQGGQWLAVVAIDPMIGHATATEHSIALGRLCVMLSRHVAHLTWVHGGAWVESLADEDSPLSIRDRELGLSIREALTSKAQVR